VRHIKKEGRPLRALDEFQGLFRVARREGFEGGRLLQDFEVVHQGPGVHVVAVRDSKVFVEAAAGRQKLREVTQMPFANTHGFISFGLEHLGDGHFIIGEPRLVVREKHPRHTHASRISPRQQGRPGRRTHGISGIELGEPHPLLGHAIEVRCREAGAVAAQVSVDENEVWVFAACEQQGQQERSGRCLQEIASIHSPVLHE
jgi:hypothetical protein